MIRRTFIKLAGALAVSVATAGLWVRYSDRRELSRSERQAMRMFLDALIPADESPGALDFGVDLHILRKADRNPHYRRQIHRGIRALDDAALSREGRRFSEVDPAERDDVIQQISESTDQRVRLFFNRTRQLAFAHYYSDPRSWPQLCYPGPPQPSGFMDYAQPPTLSCDE